jgi:hypothetical protein
MILTPKTERPVKNRGSTAQWIAQAIEVPIPNMSALILGFMNDLQR